MNLLYDIELANGKEIKGCYFVAYKIPIRGGKGNAILIYLDKIIKCFDRNDKEILNEDFVGFRIAKIYDDNENIDLTEEIMDKVKEVYKRLGYCPDFYIRRVEMMK